MSQITTHVLDTAQGKPAAGVPIRFFAFVDDDWEQIGGGETNADGRLPSLLDESAVLPAGRYLMAFDTAAYFKKLTHTPGYRGPETCFYPYVDVVFEISGDGEHYHIPLLLSPYGYSTYRGS
ncbi:hydroxyisourate hydrolase [Hahella aquimaris]|uniref:hydroxyisourate hydrolase n=1 Tax=Hahella sp. HNIBRBA332 TaxID=3015983 RepID=UPI00273AC3C2|nr:hydroxyisourate hydrolase [Hahella sp. HNIBRBA332]WLQ12176.1 hydroxyisourate hydrolase [Hahella sp. HNIBRBA332]